MYDQIYLAAYERHLQSFPERKHLLVGVILQKKYKAIVDKIPVVIN